MRIPRVIRRKPAFRRRSSPPPAARKLLIASLTAGLVLLAMLAIVFIPRGLPYEPLPILPRVQFEYNSTGGQRVVVTLISLVRPLTDYRANYSRQGLLLASIDPLADNVGNGNLRFHDVDGDGNLSVGDEFQVAYGGQEVLRVVYLPGDVIVGFWPPPP